MEKNILSVFLPNFSIELLTKQHTILSKLELSSEPADETVDGPVDETVTQKPPVLLVVGSHRGGSQPTGPQQVGKEIVLRVNAAARSLGITPGSLLADAQARSHAAIVGSFQPVKERQLLHQLALWGYRYTPSIGLDCPPSEEDPHRSAVDPRYTGLHLDISTTAHLFGDPRALMTTLAQGLREHGFESRIACAPTLGAAWALARYHKEPFPIINELRQLSAHISPLPISALRLPQATVASCAEVGLHRIGELLRLPRSTLSNRFGANILLRLDAALGYREDRFAIIQPKRLLQHTHTFSTPVADRALLLHVLYQLFDQISSDLFAHQKRAGTLGYRFLRSSPPHIERRIRLSAPTLNRRHILRLLERSVESTSFDDNRPNNDIRSVTLFAEQIERFQPELLSCFTDDQIRLDRKRGWAQFCDRIHSHFGENTIRSIQLQEHPLPEKNFGFSAVTASTTQSASPLYIPPVERPTTLFSPPERVSAIAVVPDHPPFSLRWRERTYRVRHGIGPERVSPLWWKKDEKFAERDYFRLQIEGGTWLWMYRDHTHGDWHIQGIWS